MSESLNPLPFPVQIDPDALGRVVVLMGGHSSERNVSLDSGRNVLKALQAKGVNAEAFDPAERSLGDLEKAGYDRAFIALHGRYGEDGTIQGVLEMLGIPYTGSGVMASAVAIDKISTKQMWQAGRLPTPPWEVLLGPHQLAGLAERLGLPLIIKPPHEGSTLGLTRVDSLDRLPAAYERAADIDFPVLAERFVPGTAILVLGTSALAAEVEAMGLRPVRSAADHPAAVLVGFDPTLTWTDLNEACHAVQSGAVWYGCNPDLTRPTERGLAIGLGAMLQAMGEALPGQEPVLAGKPYRPLLDETVRRLGTRRPIFVGDRLDTDILGANHAQMDSLFVLTGSHGPIDLLLAPPDQRPTWIAADVAGLLTAPPYDDGQVEVVDQALVPTSADADPITVLWSAARQAWAAADQGLRLDPAPVLALLETVAGDQS